MKVVHIFNEINFSGAETMYANAAHLFQKENIDLIAISTGENRGNYVNIFEEKGFKLYHKPITQFLKNILFFIKYFRNFYSFLRIKKVDVLHIHRAQYYWFFALCGYFARVQVIRTVHSTFNTKGLVYIRSFIGRVTARKILKIKFQSISKSVEENELVYYKNPTIRINNWYDTNRFYQAKNSNERNEIRKKIGLREDTFVIVTTGSCNQVKQHSEIIKALSIVNKEFDCFFLHIGSGSLEKVEKELAKSLGIEEKIYFLGVQKEIRDFLIASDLFVMTSKYEGLGIAAVEAMACKLPIILYDVSGLRDLISNDDNGYLIEPDFKALSDKIIESSNNFEKMKIKGENGLKFCLKNYSMNENVNKIINLYKN
ncbi:glycosyltransferase family 4 protein [Gillisia limnaea]|uniref:glycosyltransferase family 4 protein n=1 Tax=Gillisia limnaea TaxID=195907 RepID=UPI0039F03136